MTQLSKFFSGILIFASLGLGAWADNPEHRQQATDTGSCPSCDLSGADLSGLNAYQGDFSSAALQGAKLYGANLAGANLAGSDLSGADLTAANLSLADMTDANLAGLTTDERTICPDNSPGPCSFGENENE